MGPPPAKRQRRRVLLDSDDENNDGVSKRKLSSQATAPTRTRSDSTQWSPPSSPDRLSKRSRIAKGQSNGSLHTFFNTARQMPIVRKEPKHEAPSSQAETIGEPEDLIEDDSPDDEIRTRPAGQDRATLALDRRKPLQEQTQNKTVTASQDKPILASQKFLAVSKAVAKEASTQTRPVPKELDLRPWTQKYGPVSLDDLMVHKRKVADVRSWFESVYSGRNYKVR